MVKIFVGNIADGVTNDDMRQLFASHGKVNECDVLGTYGFVHMENEGEAEDAISKLDKHNLKGNPINVEKSKGGGGGGRGSGGGMFRGGGGGGRGMMRGSMRGGSSGFGGGFHHPHHENSATAKSARRSGCTKLHIANLPENIRSMELRQLFERYGYVAECDVVEDRKIAFVHIEDSATDAAIQGLNGYSFKGVPLKVQRSKNQNHPSNDRGSGPMRGSSRGGMIPTIQGRGRGSMFGHGSPGSMSRSPGFGNEFRSERPPAAERYGSNGDSSYGEHNLPPPAKDRMELLDLLDRRRRLEALDPYERRLIACPDPFNLPPPPPEYLRLLRERALVKARLPLPPTSNNLSRTLPTAGSATTSSALTRAIIARRAAASSLKDKLQSGVYDPYGAAAIPKPVAPPMKYESGYVTRTSDY
uniref:RNA-binding protein lark n=1 Tax=Phallusia mammillata TaxID=59560 RepID=A0A6F9DR56_9ASCI|nr:RNA-binding protein lark [Phallusia mammillata]